MKAQISSDQSEVRGVMNCSSTYFKKGLIAESYCRSYHQMF